MGYVPGRKWDLFLSYAHNDQAWVEVFRKQVAQGLLERLGVPVALWQDAREIKLGEHWPNEIRDGLLQSAALLSIFSPSYLNSMWCRRERETLLPDGDVEKIRVGRFYRFLKVVKNQSPARTEDQIYGQLQHVRFCSDGEEFLPGTPEWTAALRGTVGAVAELLRTMRNEQEALYVAPTVYSLDKEFTHLRAQLEDYGYNVTPEPGVGVGASKDYLRERLAAARCAVFLLGDEYSDFMKLQLDVAREEGTRLVIWPHPSAATAAGKQAALLEELRGTRDLPTGSQLMGGASVRAFIDDLLELLRPKPEATVAAGANGAGKVYLLYDTTDPEDAAFAGTLGNLIRDRKLDVFTPDPNLGAQSDRLPRHEELMRACNAVLLYRGPAANPDNWLFQTMPDVLWAERKYGRDPLKAKTFLVDDPAPLQGIGDVQLIPARDFAPQKLDPFFERMGKV